MLERQHLTVRDYNKDQKAYASMLNKMYVAAKEGEWEFDSAASVGDLCLRLHFGVSKRDVVKDCKVPIGLHRIIAESMSPFIIITVIIIIIN